MKPLIQQFIFFLFCLIISVDTAAQTPFAVPTYHCLGIYWSPIGGTSNKDVLVEFRKQDDTDWRQGLNMAYHPISETTNDKADYRGSIVNLFPNTSYEIKLTLEGTATTETFIAKTWNENFPEGETINVASQNTTYKINQSGTPTAYRVYDGGGNTIDVEHKYYYCIEVDASYVILRNFNLKGAGDTLVMDSWPPRSAILLYDGVTDIVIEDCDISDWGTHNTDATVPHQGENYESAIYSRRDVARITIQRNKFHHPTFQSNSWKDGVHPNGPQCITLFDSKGNHVIRYNEGWSDIDHYFNDVIGAGENASYEGFPGDDSDIYCNYFANSWDDGIEAEGANQNVRIWNNYITNTLMAIANAATSIGPLYVWRNVSHISYSPPPNWTYFNFMKMGYASGVEWMTGNMYVFHNTIYNVGDQGYDGLGGEGRVIRHCTSRNNILSVRNESSNSIAIDSESLDNDFDYDLHNRSVPGGSEDNGVNWTPTFVSGSGFDFSTKTGNFQLEPFSSGFDEGEHIPNFSDGYRGSAPDMGAHEKGWDNIVYGVNAVFIPPVFTNISTKELSGFNIKVYPNPFINFVRFDLSDLSDCNIIISDITGKVLRSVNNKSGIVIVERGDLDTGLYLYQVVSKQVVIKTGKLMIMEK